jgi:hypothetical protein
MDPGLWLSVTALVATNLVLIYQTVLLRRQVHAEAQSNLIDKWNKLSEFEMEDPDFHKLLMGDAAKSATKNLTDTQLRERAFAHMVFDICAGQYKLSRAIGGEVGVSLYLEEILSNPLLRSYWTRYHIRDAWPDDIFQKRVDEICRHLEGSATGSTDDVTPPPADTHDPKLDE